MNLIKLIRNKWFLAFFTLSCFGFLWLFFQSRYEDEILLHTLYRSVKPPDPAKVMEQYHRMMRSEPKSKEIYSWHRLVKILKRAGKKEEVITVLNRMVELLPEDRDLRLKLALYFHNQGKYLEAERHFVILLKGQEIDKTFLFLMAARNASKLGKYETAINRYRQLLEKSPQLTEARKELGWVLLILDTDKAPEAIREFEIVLKATPQDINALKGLVEGFRKTKNRQGISSVLEQLVTLVPDDRDLRLQLATELHNQGKYAEAEKHISILFGEKNEDE